MEKERINLIARETLKYMVENQIPVSPENYEKWFNVFKEAIYYEIPLTDSNLKELFRQKYLRFDPVKSTDNVPKKYVYRVLDDIDTSLLELINKVEEKERKIKEEKKIIRLSEDKEVVLKFVDNLAEEIIDIKDDLQKERVLIEEAKERVATTKVKSLSVIPGLKDGIQFEKDLKALLKTPKSEFCILYLNVDDMKILNEKYGEEAVNAILKKLGDILQIHLPAETPIYYIGNGEYAILLKFVDKKSAEELANKLKNVIQNKIFRYERYSFKITVTIAVVQRKKQDDYNSLLTRIQKCIEKGKKSGKNCVVSV